MYDRSLFLRVWLTILGMFGPPVALFTGGFSRELFFTVIATFIIAWPIYFLLHFWGDSLINTVFGIGGRPGKREQLTADTQKARFLMIKEQYPEALSTVNTVLEKDPINDDALFVKAQIMERLGNVKEAKETAAAILLHCKENVVIRRWASTLLRELESPPDT